MKLTNSYRCKARGQSQIAFPAILLCAALSTPPSLAQSLPSGTTLPARLQNTLSSEKDQPGKTFTLKIIQDIPVSRQAVIPRGATLTGHVVATQSIKTGVQSFGITLQFDKLRFSHQEIPVVVGLRAMASVVEVSNAGMPTNSDDNSASWTTQQIGGDVVYRGGGPVTTSWGEIVGKPVSDGVIGRLIARRDGTLPGNLHCRSDDAPHALGLFGSTACGLYGFSRFMMERDGFEQPKGQITFVSFSKLIKISAGSQLLLEILGP
jgi:hypothetical protein